MNCGVPRFGHPSMGSWVTYGLGSEAKDLPGYVVMLSDSGSGVDGGSSLWTNGFLPSTYRGVTLRGRGDPILHLSNPSGIDSKTQRARLDAIGDLNRRHLEQTGESEIASRIESYELAFRMQAAGPELINLSKETAATHAMYGLDNETTRPFGTNCLLARRMVELVRSTRTHPEIRVGSSVRGAVDLLLLATRLSELRDLPPEERAVALDAALTALSGRIQLHDSATTDPETVITELFA